MPDNINTPENWDAASLGYAEKVAPVLMTSFTEDFINLLDVNINCEVLEVAAGSGALSESLAKKVKTLLATDFSSALVEICENRMKAAGIENATCLVMDGQALILDDASFDRAVCMFGLMLFPDRARGFSELKRVLRPGGKALITAWAGPDKFQGFGLFMEGMAKAFPDLPKPDGPLPIFSLANLDEFKKEMEVAGFKNVEMSHVAKKLEIASFEDFWGMLTVGAPPIRQLFDKVGEKGQGHLRDTLEAIVIERYGNGPILVTNTATVGVGLAE